jgi:hypothetical protein
VLSGWHINILHGRSYKQSAERICTTLVGGLILLRGRKREKDYGEDFIVHYLECATTVYSGLKNRVLRYIPSRSYVVLIAMKQRIFNGQAGQIVSNSSTLNPNSSGSNNCVCKSHFALDERSNLLKGPQPTSRKKSRL